MGKKSKDTEEAIIDAALECFSKQGFHGTRTRDLARVAGVSEGTLYNYFPTKGDILFQLLVDQIEDMIAIGHVRGAVKVISGLTVSDPAVEAFVNASRRLLEEVDLDGLRAFIAEVRRAQ